MTMKSKNLNPVLASGLVLLAITQVLRHLHLFEIPDFVFGFFTGLAFSLQLTGIFYMPAAQKRVRTLKAALLTRKNR